MRVLHGHTGSVQCCKPNPHDPFLLATGSTDGSVRLWDLRTHKSVKRFSLDSLEVNQIQWTETNSLLVAVGNTIVSFDMKSKEVLVSFHAKKQVFESREDVCDFDSWGDCIVAVDDAGMLNDLVRVHTSIATCVRFVDNQTVVLSAGMDDCLRLSQFRNNVWTNVATWEAPSEAMFNPPHVNALDVDVTRKRFVAGIGDGSVAFGDLSNVKFDEMKKPRWKGLLEKYTRRQANIHCAGTCSVCFVNNNVVASASNDKTFAFSRIDDEYSSLKTGINYILTDKVNALCVSPLDTTKIFICDVSNNIKVMDVDVGAV